MRLIMLGLLLINSACVYNWGHGDRALPDGYKSVFVEIFDNKTQEVGVEIDFTNAMIKEIERSGFAVVTDKHSAELILSGSILSVTFTGSASATGSGAFPDNPTASLFTNYVFNAMTTIKVRRSSDNKVIWTTNVTGTSNYQSSNLTQAGLRSSNPLYNQSSRKQTAKIVAKNMMTEAFDRLTETF